MNNSEDNKFILDEICCAEFDFSWKPEVWYIEKQDPSTYISVELKNK